MRKEKDMKKLLINTFLGAACLLSCVDASGMNQRLSDQQKKVNATVDHIHNLGLNENGKDLDRYFECNNEELVDEMSSLLEKKKNLYPYFCRALEIGDYALARIIFMNGNIDVNLRDDQGKVPLMYALQSGNVYQVLWILEMGGRLFDDEDKLLTDSLGNNLWYYAIYGGEETGRWLCAHAEPLNPNALSFRRNELDGTVVNIAPLMLAFSIGNLELVQFLIQEGAELFNKEGGLATDSLGNDLLYYAIRGGMPTVKWLWERATVDPNASFIRFESKTRTITFSPLSMALQAGDLEMVQFLIQQGARVLNSLGKFWPDSKGNDLLYYALQGNLETLQFLLQQPGVNHNLFCNEKNLPLFIASCQLSSEEIVGWLINKFGINTDTVYEIPMPKFKNFYGPSSYKTNALIKAVGSDNVNAVKALVANGADPNALVGGLTPLTGAVRRNNIEIVKALLASSKIDVNQVDGIEGMPALLYAAQDKEHIEIFKLLVKQDDIDINKCVPLIGAVYGNNVEAVEILLNRDKINVNATDQFSNSTALHISAKRGNEPIVKLLLNHPEIDINARDNDGNTPLHLACVEQRSDIVQLLIEKGALVYAEDIDPVLFVVANFDITDLLKTLSLVMEHIDQNQLPLKSEVQNVLNQRDNLLKEEKQQILDILYPNK